MLVIKMPSCRTHFQQRLNSFTNSDTYEYRGSSGWNRTSKSLYLEHKIHDNCSTHYQKDSQEPPLSRNVSNLIKPD